MRNGFFDNVKPRLFAHRGASACAPENTLQSFRIAWSLGAPYLELDVHLSSDDEIVVIHDNSVARTTGRRGRVENMTSAELRALDAGHQFTADYGRTYPYRGKGVTIPTLRDVLTEFPDARLNIELKKTRDGVERRVADLLADHDASTRVLIASHDHDTLARFRTVAPSVSTGFSKDEVRDFLGRLRRGELSDYRPPGRAFQVPEYKGLRRVVSKPVIEAVHALAVEVHVWTVNEPVHMDRLLDWGVDGIMTDDPERAFESVARLVPRTAAADRDHAS